ncbi:cysteine peptidase family C39 domain-containing protein [Ralstonia solanacearum]|uniref:cysteine peptidase family C39 domain-containing protein n=1 Tax=Ralstonia solanacearum TaxID=305 RepID=UPI00202A4F4D|nr:cysteine peptidase family C39 domain-containing protein [Ralstonia solanacearum]MCL9861876.1 cysteine peptidase family C39 domain-containing protein [Ralstonia solanacearum]MCM2263527.1 cysteine peptidase family C39 domain-containing protein [Ralstonia solanacearum]
MAGEEATIREEDIGALVLARIARYHGISVTVEQLRHDRGLGETAFSEDDLRRAAKSVGLKSKIVKLRSLKLGNH